MDDPFGGPDPFASEAAFTPSEEMLSMLLDFEAAFRARNGLPPGHPVFVEASSSVRRLIGEELPGSLRWGRASAVGS